MLIMLAPSCPCASPRALPNSLAMVSLTINANTILVGGKLADQAATRWHQDLELPKPLSPLCCAIASDKAVGPDP